MWTMIIRDKKILEEKQVKLYNDKKCIADLTPEEAWHYCPLEMKRAERTIMKFILAGLFD